MSDITRTFVIGDIHGDLDALEALLAKLPMLRPTDNVVFLGDYVDRGPDSAGVIALIRETLPRRIPAKIIALRGNHEDAWLRVIREGWPGFVFPAGNGCRECLASFTPTLTDREALAALFTGGFFPPDVVAWMEQLPYWFEDCNGLYVHAGVPKVNGRWLHPSEVDDPVTMLWLRTPEFFVEYDGKMLVCGHTVTSTLPPDLSQYTPGDPDDLFWAGGQVFAIDTGAGKGGFLTALELPAGIVHESRDKPPE